MRETVRQAARNCPTELAMEVVGGKWKVVILEHLAARTMRFGELQRSLGAVTARMLTRQLRELETDGLITRTVHPEVPPRVEYALSELGRTLVPIIAQLRAWGEEYRAGLAAEPGSPARA
ncbi:transcriptional regulator, HxlR family [Pseudonocardia thermophila]|uniref:Transcriptional regulator, HxlR family n=1 Tax=Pseudonocardia thermophila TaxID=1848 RepID=A0A1M6SJV7_PSETH|nr:helix-turn-helix domain-containing protein [Pseudonocardia thermophila]SHK45022.1 transcriptional regulator, HxlR family [Pseudonocardia thermophila]